MKNYKQEIERILEEFEGRTGINEVWAIFLPESIKELDKNYKDFLQQALKEIASQVLDDYAEWFDGGSGQFKHHIEQFKKEKGIIDEKL